MENELGAQLVENASLLQKNHELEAHCKAMSHRLNEEQSSKDNTKGLAKAYQEQIALLQSKLEKFKHL